MLMMTMNVTDRITTNAHSDCIYSHRHHFQAHCWYTLHGTNSDVSHWIQFTTVDPLRFFTGLLRPNSMQLSYVLRVLLSAMAGMLLLLDVLAAAAFFFPLYLCWHDTGGWRCCTTFFGSLNEFLSGWTVSPAPCCLHAASLGSRSIFPNTLNSHWHEAAGWPWASVLDQNELLQHCSLPVD